MRLMYHKSKLLYEELDSRGHGINFHCQIILTSTQCVIHCILPFNPQ